MFNNANKNADEFENKDTEEKYGAFYKNNTLLQINQCNKCDKIITEIIVEDKKKEEACQACPKNWDPNQSILYYRYNVIRHLITLDILNSNIK